MATLGERMIGAMKLDVNTFEEIERDPTAMTQAITVIAIAAVASAIGNMFRAGIGVGTVLALIFTMLGYVAWAALVWAIGTKVMPDPTTKADFHETFRVTGFAAAPGVFYLLAIIPFLGPLISFGVAIWSLIVMVVAVRQVLDYKDTFKAVLVCVIGFVAYMIIYLMLVVPFAAASWVLS